MAVQHFIFLFRTGPVVQSVACPTTDQGVASLMPARSHTFMEVDHEITYLVILLPSADSIGLLSVTSESMCTKYWLTA